MFSFLKIQGYNPNKQFIACKTEHKMHVDTIEFTINFVSVTGIDNTFRYIVNSTLSACILY